MKRFSKTLALLMVTLLLLISGVNTALDRLTNDPGQSSISFYNQQGDALLNYDGTLAFSDGFARPIHTQPRVGLVPRA